MRRLLVPLVALALLGLLLGLPAAAAAAPQGAPVDGGPAPTQSTPIEAGTAYADDVRPGEARWFSLDVETGQELGATLTEYGETEYGCCLKISLNDPDFDPVQSDTSVNSDGTAQTLRAETDEDGVDDSGTYYLSVELDSTTAKRPVAFDFSVDVAGEGMLTSSPSPTDEGTPSASASAGADTAATSAGEDSDGVSPLLWGAVGVLALLLVVLLVMVVALLRRLAR